MDPGRTPLPSVSRQKSYIIDQSGILDRKTKLAILSLVMMEIGQAAVRETGVARDVDVDLDVVCETNEEVLGHIYNIMRARLASLSLPAGAAGAADRS